MQRVRVSSEQSPVQKLGNAQMSLSPRFRLASPPPPLLPLQQPLIPGLPDDLALSSLLRLPVDAHPACRSVCRRWRLLLATKEAFFTRRHRLGFRHPWLFVFAFHSFSGKPRWLVLDLSNLHSWHTIPAMPCRDKLCPTGFQCAADGSTMLVCGGLLSDADSPLDLVVKFEIHRNRWTVVNRMLTPRSFFAAGVVGGLVYVAGGSGAQLSELDSAEVLDPITGNWKQVKSMGGGIAAYDAAVVDGRLLLTEGWVWPFLFSPRGRVYDPGMDSWEEMRPGLREGWTGASAVVHGRLFVVSEHERMMVKVYDAECDEWETVDGSPVPERVGKPFSVAAYADKIYIVCRDLNVAIGHVRSRCGGGCEARRKQSFSVTWQYVSAPPSFRDFTPAAAQILIG